MKLGKTLSDLTFFSMQVDKDLKIVGLSNNLHKSDFGKQLLNQDFTVFLTMLFNNEQLRNPMFYDGFLKRVKDVFKTGVFDRGDVVVSDIDLKTDKYYSFSYGLESFVQDEELVFVRFSSFRLLDGKEEYYQSVFNEYKDHFHVIKKLTRISHFLVDYSVSSRVIHTDSIFPSLIDIKPTKDNKYIIKRPGEEVKDNEIIRDKNFFFKMDMLRAGEIDVFTDEYQVGEKWLKVEAKIIKRDSEGNSLVLAGILYDISDYRNYKDLEYLFTIYELAITSGGIGIFHYDVDKYSSKYFEANKIYADLCGLDPNENDLYLLTDFEETLMEVESDITDRIDTKKTLDKLFSGDIEGTQDDILKIKHKKTGEIKYLLSSSKIDSKYEDGSPKRFGGIVLDITERIQSEKSKIEYAYRDELTQLSNNRKLIKDMRTNTDGIGLFFDLDDFKKINDRYGHLFGDKILRLYAESLTHISKQFDNVTPYRLYGDEFFVFAQGAKTDFPEKFEDKLNNLLEEVVSKQYPDINLDASMGVSIYETGMDIDDFVKDADYSMYRTKIKKKARR